MKFVILLIVVFSLCNAHLMADSIRIEDFSYKDGLTSSGVFNAYKDSRGFLWLCTLNGLFRYDGYNFRNINTLVEDTLNIETFCITEDSDHNLWIGTSKGIVFYDTRNERLIHVRLSLDDNFRCAQILFFKDKMWIASNLGLIGVSLPPSGISSEILDAKLLLPDSAHIRTLQDNIINVLFEIPNSSSIWVGTNGALYELDVRTLNFTHVNSHAQNSIRGISQYNSNQIISSWDGGVFLVDPFSHELVSDSFITEVNKAVGDKRVMSAILDTKQRLWVATYGSGLYIFEKKSNASVSFVNFRNDQLQSENLKSDFINQLYIDNSGIAWLCMNQPALTKVFYQESNLNYFDFFSKKNESETKEILSVNASADKNKVWISTNGDGIYFYDIENHKFKQFTDKSTTGLQLQSNEVSTCFQDSKGNLWIVYRRIGLFVVPARVTLGILEGRLQEAIKPLDVNTLLSNDSRINSYITTFYEDSHRRIWIGAWGSLHVIELGQNFTDQPTTNEFISKCKVTCIFSEANQEQISFPISPLLSILELDENQYLLGLFGPGIIKLKEITPDKFSKMSLPINEYLPSKGIKLILKDKHNGIWIGTNSGLSRWDLNTNQLKNFTVKDGLSCDIINNIVEDNKGNVWISTPFGISEIKAGDFSVLSYVSSDKEKLNQYIEHAGIISTKGMICFSTNKELAILDPDSVGINQIVAPLYFTQVKINNKTVIPGEKYRGTVIIDADINECKSIQVPYNHNLSLEFAALDFINADRLQYKYRIGTNKEWILLNANQRSLNLPNMNHGEYTLSIMLANSREGKSSRTIKIHFLPPFWQSKPAIFIYFLILVVIFLIYRRLANQRYRQKSIIEKERFERKKLEEMDKMKTEFFSNISHEFRTPLSLIINPLEKIINETELTEKNTEKLKLVLKSSNRLLKLTNELMDFSKVEKQLIFPEFQQCEMVSFITDICRLFNNFSDSMNIDYKLECSFEKLVIPIDKGMIEKVMFNLLSNAFKYTPVNGTIIANMSTQNSDGNDFVKISVINTGEGIAKEHLDKIFDRFYQVNNLQNRNIEGTGIGLSLVKSFVDLHNGKVEVKSQPTVETCFDVYLPVNQPNASITEVIYTPADKSSKDSGTEFKTADNRPTSHYRVLVVEDEDDIRNYIIGELSIDFKISVATNGEEGIKLANEIIPDLIITDIIMPVVTGIDLCKTLKNQMATSHIPIIILSAKTTVSEQIEGLEMGADVYMIKPFNIDHLKTQILRLIHFRETVFKRYLKENTLIPKDALSGKLDEEFMQRIIAFIESNLTDVDLNVEQLANCVSLSTVQTYRKVKAITGRSVVEFIRTVRLKKAAELVIEQRLNFSEIAYETGFSTPSYFSKCFHDHFGKSPSEYVSDYGAKL
jgi:signal transduction histidine kinase/ligand-binding sensor domain-containing protein/AraC-like DNA-binding protein